LRDGAGGSYALAIVRLNRDRIRRLVDAQHPCVRIVTEEEEHARSVVWDIAASMRLPLKTWSAVGGLRDEMLEPGSRHPEEGLGTESAAAALLALSRIDSAHLCVTLDLAPHLGDPVALRALREHITRCRRTGARLVMIDHSDDVPDVLARVAPRIDLALPDEEELREIVRRTLRERHRNAPIDLDLTRAQLQAMVRNLRGLTRAQAEQVVLESVVDDSRLDEADMDQVVARKRQYLHVDGLLEFVEAPTSMSAIGGLESLKRWLTAREGAFDDAAAEFGLTPPRGVLLLGVQGAGKSLCAKAIATAWRRPLLRLDPGALYDRYVGESEKRLRGALRQAEAMSPIVLWIDEIEKGFASASSRSTDGGLSQRMFGALLTWMQEHAAPVFLVATANNIEALPPELLRKGRFDEIFFVDLPDEAARRMIFAIHLQKRNRDAAQVDLDALAQASVGYSGAEIEQAVISALHDAYASRAAVTTALLLQAVRNSPPLSVTMRERIDGLRRWADGRCVPAN
jgi:SpoVK/Ycf46/Vps4 family AAA+-type ATPase